MSSDLTRRLVLFAIVLVAALLFLLPSIAVFGFGNREVFQSWISKPINLGLDLSGGVHLVYEVQTREAVKGNLQTTSTAVRSELRKEKLAVTRVKVTDDRRVEISLLRADAMERAKQLISERFREISFERSAVEEGRGLLVYNLSEERARQIEFEAVDLAIEKLRMRVDQFGVSEPLIQRQGGSRILLQMPGVSDIEAVKHTVGSVAKLEFKLVAAGGGLGGEGQTIKNREGSTLRVEDDVLMTGDAVKTARISIANGQVEVNLSLTPEGAQTFYRITQENVGRMLAIILDGVSYSAPVINEPIAGGEAQITGRFSVDEAKQLAVVLRSGALPAPLLVLEERTVGPTLGRESIEKGVVATLIGFAFIVIFMLGYYQKSGAIAVVSLLLNGFLILACLSAFGATLTLPGIAGLALTIGMAVDSNVIIFERIRDELRNGSSRDAAVLAGFDKAFTAILDSNVTTLLAGAVLYFAGTGPIRGFAVTLTIGIVTTVYCATFATRLLFDALPLRSSKDALSI